MGVAAAHCQLPKAKKDGAQRPMPGHVLTSTHLHMAPMVCEPRTCAASAVGPRPGAGAGRSGSPATEPSGPGAKLDPPDHTQP
jgi:hypothetical protein